MMLSIGDFIRVAGRHFLYHYYVYVGPLGPNGEDLFHVDTQRGACLVHQSVLAYEQVLKVIPPEYRQHSELIRRRALEVHGKPYHETLFNCEIGATYVQSGKSQSPQLEFGVWVVLAALAVQAIRRA